MAEAAAQPEAADTIWKASAYGDLDALRRLAAAGAPGDLDRPDTSGFRCLQWAALNNHVAAASFLLQEGVAVDARDPTGQTPLHWAAVRGAAAAAEALLRAGADAGAADSKGYTPAHVAAQYGQTALLYRLALRWGVDADAADAEGRSPLHWAAYKGFDDAARLLLVLGAAPAAPDAEGCSPLHWAAIRGHADAATVLLQGGADAALDARDATGATPAQLAVEKGHRQLGVYLAQYREKRASVEGVRRGLLGFLARGQLAPVVWAIVIGMLALLAGAVVRAPALPPPAPATVAAGWATFALATAGLYFLYRTTVADPGYLPRNSAGAPPRRAKGAAGAGEASAGVGAGGGGAAADGGAGGIDSPALWAGGWSQLCVSCRIVRPLRAKHCPISRRCVREFDHWCPWVGNAVGRGNRHVFLAFLWLEFAATLAAGGVAAARLRTAAGAAAAGAAAGAPPAGAGAALGGAVAFAVCDVLLAVALGSLAVAQASQVARNVTTNEMANWHRYGYLHGPGGGFRNPFDRGWRANCTDVCSPATAPPAPYALAGSSSAAGGGAGKGERAPLRGDARAAP